MKIKIFESTAAAIAALVESAELVLGQRLRMGQHTIEFNPEPQDVKVVEINGTLLGYDPNQPMRIDFGSRFFMAFNEGNDQRWKPRASESVFYLDHPTDRSNVFRPKTYRVTWDGKAGRPKLVD